MFKGRTDYIFLYGYFTLPISILFGQGLVKNQVLQPGRCVLYIFNEHRGMSRSDRMSPRMSPRNIL